MKKGLIDRVKCNVAHCTLQYPYKLAAVKFLLYLALRKSNSTLYQICLRSASHLLNSRNDLSTVLDFARPMHPILELVHKFWIVYDEWRKTYGKTILFTVI